ncbi:apolipoprotein N-acyltransferase [Spirillospora sp. CA-294931]|uniref:apolipoprotein N-acyltransferase n=1 Tax=Spirillospora sp. CA-294931 TaxID=3240042 RepID=UPI003D8DDB6E
MVSRNEEQQVAQETLPERPAAPEPREPSRKDGPGAERPGRLRRVRAGGRAGWPRTLLALGSGLTLCAAFPPIDIPPLAPVGVAMLALAVLGQGARTGAWLGLLSGVTFFLPVLEGIGAIGPDAWIVLSLVQALYLAPLGACLALVTRLPAWPLWTAAAWVAEELVRGRVPFGGFPWARLAFSQTATPLTPYASVGGAPLVTFLTALAGGLLAYGAHTAYRAHRAGDLRRATRPLAAAVACLAALIGGGLLIPTPTGGEPVTVAVIQGNVPRLGLDFLGQRKAVLNNHVQRTRELAAQVRAGKVPRPELVVWPENASDLDPYTEPDAFNSIDAAVKDVGVPVLVGALTDTPDGSKVENRGIVWDPRTGPGDYYVKRHPVPFGEYLPFRDLLTKMITRFERVPRDFARGDRSGVMRLGPVTIGDVICFEVAYDAETRASAGGAIMVVQTNNATYGKTGIPPQQIAMSRLRAVEHGRTILVAATSGISAIVAPDGRMLDRSGEFVPDIQVRTVPARTARTLADRVGAAPEWALAALAAAAVIAAARRNGSEHDEGNTD